MPRATTSAAVNATTGAMTRIAMCFGVALLAAPLVGDDAAASPKGYDIDRLLRQGLPAWRSGHGEPSPPPPARPLERIPNVPAPAILPPAERALPSARTLAPAPMQPPAEPRQASTPELQPHTLPPAQPLTTLSAPATAPETPPPAAREPQRGGRRIIRAPGSPRSSVSGAWAAGN